MKIQNRFVLLLAPALLLLAVLLILPSPASAEMDTYMGTIIMFAGAWEIEGYVAADGRLLDIGSYSALYSIYGTIYGGDGRTTFAIPDMTGRIPVGAGSGPGLYPKLLGQQGGLESVALSKGQMSSHTHTPNASANGPNTGAANGSVCAKFQRISANNAYAVTPDITMSPDAIETVGSGQAHDNMPPFETIKFQVGLDGLYPPHSY